MSFERAANAVVAALLAACTQHAPPEHAPVTTPSAPVAASAKGPSLTQGVVPLELLLRDIQGTENLRVPDFELVAANGGVYASRDLVGKRPFITVFFATWCDFCQGELRAVQRALSRVGPIPVIPVSADGPETWEAVPAYLAAFGIYAAPVRATDHRRFFSVYNPSDSLPSLAIVGQSGALVDYIHGYDPANAERLVSSLRQAKVVAPLSWPGSGQSSL
jgi:thiol-disulfide isomerase/thioredoxin